MSCIRRVIVYFADVQSRVYARRRNIITTSVAAADRKSIPEHYSLRLRLGKGCWGRGVARGRYTAVLVVSVSAFVAVVTLNIIVAIAI